MILGANPRRAVARIARASGEGRRAREDAIRRTVGARKLGRDDAMTDLVSKLRRLR